MMLVFVIFDGMTPYSAQDRTAARAKTALLDDAMTQGSSPRVYVALKQESPPKRAFQRLFVGSA